VGKKLRKKGWTGGGHVVFGTVRENVEPGIALLGRNISREGETLCSGSGVGKLPVPGLPVSLRKES